MSAFRPPKTLRILIVLTGTASLWPQAALSRPADGVADRHVHPVEPTAVRLTLAGRF